MISFVCPIYNTEQYLKNTILSVVNQTCDDWELILVDDGSTDKSYEVCKQFAKKYKNIKCVTQENNGPFRARKLGISLANGDYIAFIDSDDLIDKTYVEEVTKIIDSDNPDIIVFSMNYQKADGSFVEYSYKNYSNTIKDFKKALLEARFSSLCTKVYKKILCDNNEFKAFDCKYIFGEDLLMQCYIVDNAQTIKYIDKPLYHYLYRKQSTMNSPIDINNLHNKINPDCIDVLTHFNNKWCLDSYKSIYLIRVINYISLFNGCLYKYKWKDFIDKFLAYNFFAKKIDNRYLCDLKLYQRFEFKLLFRKEKTLLFLFTRLLLIRHKIVHRK